MLNFNEIIDKSNRIIIYGESKDRDYARMLLLQHLNKFHVLDTRKYLLYHKTAKNVYDGRRYTGEKNFQYTLKIADVLAKKRLPIIIDNFSDIYDTFIHREKKRHPGKYFDIQCVGRDSEAFLNRLQLWNKKVILFCEPHPNRHTKQQLKFKAWWRTMLWAETIICIENKHLRIEKDRNGIELQTFRNLLQKRNINGMENK